MSEVVAKTAVQALRWIVENEHHEGFVRGPHDAAMALVLVGAAHRLVIPSGMTQGLMQPADFDATRRMFEPTLAGRELLAASD